MSAQPWCIINLVLAVWLALSALLWPHDPAQFLNAWIVGASGAMFASGAAIVPGVRALNTALSVWLLAAGWVLPVSSTATFYNDVIVAVTMFLASLPGPSRAAHDARRESYDTLDESETPARIAGRTLGSISARSRTKS